MPLVDEIQKDMYKAMKEKEKERINALRNIIGKLKYRYIDKGDKLTEQEEIKVIQSSDIKFHYRGSSLNENLIFC